MKNCDFSMVLPLEFSYEDSRLNIKAMGEEGICLADLQGFVVIDGQEMNLCEAEVHSEFEGELQIITYEIAPGIFWKRSIKVAKGGVVINSRLENKSDGDIVLGKWTLLQAESVHGGAIELGDELENIRFFRWHPWNMCVEELRGERDYYSDNLLHLYSPKTGRTLLCAFDTISRMGSFHELQTGKKGIKKYSASCTFGSYTLLQGESIEAEELRIALFADPYAALEHWAEGIYQREKPSFAPLPPVGWIGTWNKNMPQADYTIQNCEAIRRLMPGFDISYVWTSQSNLKDYIPGNWTESHPREFPQGMEPFFEKLLELGFTPGLWISPFWFYGQAEKTLERCREFLMRDDEGKVISEESIWCWRYPDDERPAYHMTKYYLDGTHPLTVGYLKELYSHYRELGVKYYMLDFLGIKENAKLHNAKVTPLEAAHDTLATIRQAVGEDTHLQTAVSSTPAYVGIINAARVGRDFGEGRYLDEGIDGPKLNDWHNATHVLHDDHYSNVYYFFQNAAANYFTHRKLYMNDLNVLTVDLPHPLEHARMAVTLFGLCGGSPIMLGDDFRRIDRERLRLVKLCLPRNNANPKPLDLFDNVQPENHCRMLSLRVEKPWGHYDLVTVFNTEDEPYRAQIDFAKLGYDGNAHVRIYEFWNNEYCGTYAQRFETSIPQNSCRLYRLEEARKHPWLLSTDMHIQQGAAEVLELNWDAESMTLSGTVTRPVRESGNLYFLMPRHFRLENTKGAFLIKELLDMNVIIRLPVEFKNEKESFCLSFSPWPLKSIVPQGYFEYTYADEWLAYKEKHRKPGDTRVYE